MLKKINQCGSLKLHLLMNSDSLAHHSPPDLGDSADGRVREVE